MEAIKVDRLLKYDGTNDDHAVPSAAADVWSHSHKIAFGSVFCVSLRAKSTTGTPDIDVYLEETHIDPASVSTGEGVIGDTANGWKIPEGSSKLLDVTDEAWHHFTVSPISLPYLRLQFDPQGANPADCTVETHISKQEQW